MRESQNKITIYRGSHQIGGCATEIRTKNHRIVIDFGANLPGNEDRDVISDDELVKTVFDGSACDAVLFSHYHGDHIGLYKQIPPEIPLYIGPLAKKIMEQITERIDHLPGTKVPGLPRIQKMKTYTQKKPLENFGDIRVTPFLVDHSALDAYMFLIETGGKKILFTGDFRDHGIAGENESLEQVIQKYIGEVDTLITEGTMLSRLDESGYNPIRTEKELGQYARKLFQENHESVILVSSTNLDSIMEFYLALPWNMGFVCDAYQAKLMMAAIKEKGKEYKDYRIEMIHERPRRFHIIGNMENLGLKQNCDKADFNILKKKGFTMLARENKPIFRQKMEEYCSDPLIIYSKWKGYLKGRYADPKVKEFIGSHRMEILHTSGHAYVETIEKVIRLTNPKVIIPMHTECADSFADIPEFAPYRDRVRTLQDGEQYCF